MGSERVVAVRSIEREQGGVYGNKAGPAETMQVINKSGGALARGDVVILDTTNSTANLIAVTTTASGNSVKVVGVMYETVANNSLGRVQISGPHEGVKVNGTTAISAGDPLGTFTAAKIAQKNTGTTGLFATALAAYAVADSLGVIAAFISRPNWAQQS